MTHYSPTAGARDDLRSRSEFAEALHRHAETRDDTRAQLEQALTELGDTADQVAETLARRGITGAQGVGCECPIAAYLIQELSDVDPIVLASRIDIRRHGHQVSATPPPGVAAFVHAFDHGAYPALERRTA